MSTPIETRVTSNLKTTRVATLHSAFSRIQVEHMQDVPLLNPALTVATVGFRQWKTYWLGVLVTPWMMKLVGLPMLMQPLAQAEVNWQFPFGEYTLMRDVLPEPGAYYSVSLFSPMHDFSDQTQAEATAAAVMQSLFESPPQRSVESALPAKRGTAQGMTRRELLFGLFRDIKSE